MENPELAFDHFEKGFETDFGLER